MGREELASVRTHLANERTFLAYVRTALAFMAAGAGMIHFLDSLLLRIAGWIIIATGAAIAFFGFARFLAVKRRIAGAKKEDAGVRSRY